jgi:hypothetical protein
MTAITYRTDTGLELPAVRKDDGQILVDARSYFHELVQSLAEAMSPDYRLPGSLESTVGPGGENLDQPAFLRNRSF